MGYGLVLREDNEPCRILSKLTERTTEPGIHIF